MTAKTATSELLSEEEFMEARPPRFVTTNLTRSPQERTIEHEILHYLGACGHYLHMYRGGRSGKIPVLSEIYRLGGSTTQQELLSIFAVKDGTLSETLTRLEHKGLVRRSRSDSDRRRVLITLTEEGSKKAQENIAYSRDFEEQGFACLSKEEQAQLLSLLKRVADQWKEVFV